MFGMLQSSMLPTVTSSEIIHKNPWWQLRHDVLTLPNGNPGNYYIVELRPAVLIIAKDQDRLLVIKQYRHPVGRELTQFPMGLAEANEESLMAAERELKEETGFEADHWQLLGRIDRAPGFATGTLDVFLASKLHDSQHTHLEETEADLRHDWISIDEWKRSIERNEITCSNTLSAWALYLTLYSSL